MTQSWPNFKGRFLEPSLTDANRYGKICLVNICPGDICPYPAMITFVQATYLRVKIVHIRNISAVTGSELCQAQEILMIGLIFIFEGQTAQYSSARVTFLQKITFNGKLL